ncbi:YaaA family protein [Kocuria sp.]|uniref:YaaA family protein n=1 Tax=Kocuria sp. TaxID=1871328 RepID=UPI0026E10EEE|nr:peroxide stress protein YaaA [Kocuria sp.]MDO5618257.1 peroxide stress protein YaaA [Kocuria sp.]
MLILLPPSETKAIPAAGDPVDLTALSWPELTAARARVIKALTKVSAQKNALEVLGVGPSLAQDVARNRDLEQAPAGPALEVYTGVLFDALNPAGFTAAQRRVAAESLVVISAVWGAVRPSDRVPAYRLSGGTSLRGLGKAGGLKLSTYWKPHLAAALTPSAENTLVIDCRSATYTAAFQAPRANTVGVKVVQLVNGVRIVVSHNAKHTRGLLARHLIEQEAQGTRIETPADLAEVAAQLWEVELRAPTATKAGELTVVLPETVV